MAPAKTNSHLESHDLYHKTGKKTIVKNIIVIGDSSIFSEEEQFRSNECDVIHCVNIHEANKFLFSDSMEFVPYAICCDLNLPQNTLIHFAGSLLSNEKLCNVPFILITDVPEGFTENKFSSVNGIDDIVTSDIPVSDLLEKIDLIRKFKTYKKSFPYKITAEEKIKIDYDSILRRIADILLSSIFILLLSPIILLICLLIKLESEGPIFYVSLRAGKGYKVFKFYKFRTMIPDADQRIHELRTMNQYDMLEENTAMFFKVKGDPRVTAIGRFLRNTSLDELPQLFNVLIGDMSIVGNRPLPLYEACTLTTDEAARRFLAPAGITGLWQVEKRGRPEMSVQERIDLDIDYANNHSFFYDMKILFITPKGIIQRSDV